MKHKYITPSLHTLRLGTESLLTTMSAQIVSKDSEKYENVTGSSSSSAVIWGD